jgi:hypothetical protein
MTFSGNDCFLPRIHGLCARTSRCCFSGLNNSRQPDRKRRAAAELVLDRDIAAASRAKPFADENYTSTPSSSKAGPGLNPAVILPCFAHADATTKDFLR